MLVRCCKSYEVVEEGDVGTVVTVIIDYEELDDLNVLASIIHHQITQCLTLHFFCLCYSI